MGQEVTVASATQSKSTAVVPAKSTSKTSKASAAPAAFAPPQRLVAARGHFVWAVNKGNEQFRAGKEVSKAYQSKTETYAADAQAYVALAAQSGKTVTLPTPEWVGATPKRAPRKASTPKTPKTGQLKTVEQAMEGIQVSIDEAVKVADGLPR